jgi:hypothetical protein
MEIIPIIPVRQEYKDFMSMPDGLNKNITFYNNLQGLQFTEANICKKDGLTYYSVSSFKIVKSTKSSYYTKRTARDGFTINEKGKLKVWFGKNIYQIPHIMELFKYYNFNWLHTGMLQFMTKTIVEKMISGKLTNNLDVAKEYIKLMRLKCSPALFVKLFAADTAVLSKIDFLRQASVSKDINHLIEYLVDTDNKSYERIGLINDMIKEAQILERKIDFTWSVNRLKQEHKQWTEEIMKLEIDALDDTVVPYIENFDRYTPLGFKLLKTQKEVFYEGKNMKHCIYTAYWNNIKNNTYLAYHINLNGEEATLGVNIYNDRIVFNQCYGRYNGSVSTTMSILVKEFFDQLYDQVERDGILKTINAPVVVEELLPW